nr:malonyl CoA-acyl carrier protein transacylase [uncultured bacterium]
MAGLIKTALSLEHGQLPPSLHYESPNPQIDFGGRFRVNAGLTDWPSNGTPRRAGVSSFGIGGTNAHVVLEEAPAAEPSGPPSRPWQLLTLSARTPEALDQTTVRLGDHLWGHPGLELADVAFTLHTGRKGFEHRRMLVSSDLEDAASALAACDPERILDGRAESSGRLVSFLFPGLGDHYEGMGSGLYRSEPGFRERVDRCAEILRGELGLDLREVLYKEDEEPAATDRGPDLRRMLGRRQARELDRPSLAHAAIFVTEYALAGLLRDCGIEPAAMIGYSLGELTAACLAGVLTLEDALRLVVRRAKLAESLPVGAMLAVPLPEEELAPLLGDRLSLAAVNGPSLCVASGPVEAVEELETRLAGRGVVTRRLSASRGFHSREMEPLFEPLRELVSGFELRPPSIPYISTVTGTWITSAQATDPDYWANHLCRTVRFAEGVGELLRQPSPILLEVGPGHALGSFALQHPESGPGRTVLSSLRHSYECQPDQAVLLRSLGQLWLAGAEIDWAGFHAGERRRRMPLPTYPFQRERYWIEAAPAQPPGRP